MSGLDWVIVIFIGLSVVAAVAQGFFFEVFSLAGVIVGFLVAAWAHPSLAPLFLPYVKSAAFANLGAFLTIFFVIGLMAGMAGRIARWAIQGVGLTWVDRVLGGAFGLVRGLVVVIVALMAITAFAPETKMLSASVLTPYFLLAGRTVAYAAPAEVREQFYAGEDLLRGLRHPDKKANQQGGD